MTTPTNEQKNAYYEVLNDFWPEIMTQYSPRDITTAVMEATDRMLENIADCTEIVTLIKNKFKHFYTPNTPDKWAKIILMGAKAIFEWRKDINNIRGISQARAKTCVNNMLRSAKNEVLDLLQQGVEL